jgi:hypothetical protein
MGENTPSALPGKKGVLSNDGRLVVTVITIGHKREVYE